MLLIVDDLSSTPVTNVTRQSHAYFGVVNLIGGLAGPLSCQLCVTLRVNSRTTRLNSTQLSCNTSFGIVAGSTWPKSLWYKSAYYYLGRERPQASTT